MLAPLDAPDSTKADPANGIALDLSIAWNSIAHREFSLSTDGSTSRLLASEPLKVGIIVPFKGVSVGDYVWYDADRDGFQSPDEDAIPNVRVELLDANNNVVQETTTDANGYYSFQYLTRGLLTRSSSTPQPTSPTRPNSSSSRRRTSRATRATTR